jgi:polysaccharide biosynthesis protein PslH
MMNILFLTQIIPYPPDAGPKVKTWHVLRYLASLGHKIYLVSFLRPEEKPYVRALKEICEEVHTVPITRSRLADVRYWMRSHITKRPFLIERDDLPMMSAAVKEILARTQIDAIHADQLTMVQFALPREAPRPAAYEIRALNSKFKKTGTNGKHISRIWPITIFDAHNAVWTILDRMRQNAPFILKPVAAIEAQRIKRYEGMILQNFDHTLAVTEQDCSALLEAAKLSVPLIPGKEPRVKVIPIAVDTGIIQPVERNPVSMNIVTLGTLHYPPNADGIRWFINQVFPLIQERIPEATLTIIGKNPPRDFQEIAKQRPDSITLTGYVPDLTPYLEQSTLMVVPVRAGGGMRVRILEAFARGMPVVTTTVGLEGIDAKPGEEVLVADTAEDFAEAVVKCLRNCELQEYLGGRGRRLAEVRYDWQVVLKKMGEVYQEIEIECAKGARSH